MAGDGGIGRVDRFQRRWPAVGLPIAVAHKYGDDQGNYLAVIVTYYALFAVLPLLLLATTILGFVLQGDPELQQRVLDSALSQFPVLGDQFRQPGGLSGSTTAVVVGSLAATYGAMGLGAAVQNATNIVWQIPRNSRPNPILLRIRGLLIVGFGGVAVLGLTTASVLISNTTVIAWFEGSPLRWLARVVSVLVTGAVLYVLMRLSAARADRARTTLPGAMLTALLWHLVQQVGAVYVTQVLAGANALNQAFGVVLGLMAALFLLAVAGMFGVELNVVLDRHLWPRALLTPFTDSVRLTDADRRAYRGYAAAQRHKGFETVTVDFGENDESTRPDHASDTPGT
jgi:YihY family inner membrane protein